MIYYQAFNSRPEFASEASNSHFCLSFIKWLPWILTRNPINFRKTVMPTENLGNPRRNDSVIMAMTEGKRIRGRKRHLAVDVLGPLLVVCVHST